MCNLSLGRGRCIHMPQRAVADHGREAHTRGIRQAPWSLSEKWHFALYSLCLSVGVGGLAEGHPFPLWPEAALRNSPPSRRTPGSAMCMATGP